MSLPLFWSLLVSIIVPLCIALCAVWFAQWISSKREYSKAKANVKAEINTNIKLCSDNLSVICANLKGEKSQDLKYDPFLLFHDLAWNTWKGLFLLRENEIIEEVEELYRIINFSNRLLQRMEDMKWYIGSTPHFSALKIAKVRIGNLNLAQAIIRSKLLPLLNEANKSISKGKRN